MYEKLTEVGRIGLSFHAKFVTLFIEEIVLHKNLNKLLCGNGILSYTIITY